MNRMTKGVTSLLAAAMVLAPISQAAAFQLSQPSSTAERIRIDVVGVATSQSALNIFNIRANGVQFQVNAPQSGTRVRTGDKVRVVGALGLRNIINAEQVEVLEGRDRDEPQSGGRRSTVVSGTVRSVDSNRNRMAVDAGNSNVVVRWDEETEFVRNNNRSAARDFRTGDRVRVVGNRRADGEVAARRIIFGGQAGWTNGAIGEIVALNSRSRTADIDFDGDIWAVRLDSARIRTGNQNAGIESLRLGQDVRVYGRAQNQRTVEANQVDIMRGGNRADNDRDRPGNGRFERNDDRDHPGNGRFQPGNNRDRSDNTRTFDGRVLNVSAPNSAFRINVSGSDEVRFATDRNTTFVRGNRSVNFSSLQDKQRVRVTAERNGDTWTARRVEILN